MKSIRNGRNLGKCQTIFIFFPYNFITMHMTLETKLQTRGFVTYVDSINTKVLINLYGGTVDTSFFMKWCNMNHK